MKRFLSLIIVVSLFSCKLFNKNEPDSPPYFTIGEPSAEVTSTNIGNSHTVKGTAKDPDGDSINYKTLKDGLKVNDTNEYTFTIDKKGMTRIDVIAYNALSDTLTKYFSAENRAPVANNISANMDEESTKRIPQTDLGSDPDGDNLSYNVTSTSAGVNAQFSNGQLEITGLENEFGNESVNYSVTDGEETKNGTVSLTVNNTRDDPKPDAGSDLSKTIDEQIDLDGSNSSHPDNPVTTITSYEWSQISGPSVTLENSNTATPNFTAATEGEYEFRLKVLDSKGYEATDNVKVTVDSDKITVNATNVLNDVGIGGLEVMLAGKTAVTNGDGVAELEYPSNAGLSDNLKIQDEAITGVIGDYFNFSDTENTNIAGDLEYSIEMIPNVEWDNSFYDNIITYLKEMRGGDITTTPGEHPQDYPILININESEMPGSHYLTGITDAINHINTELGFEMYRITTSDDARYVFDYSDINSRFDLEYIQKNDVWYIDSAIVYIMNDLSSSNPVKETTIHEIGIHGAGLREHSLDKKDIGYAPTRSNETSGYSNNEKKGLDIHLKLSGGTNLSNHIAD